MSEKSPKQYKVLYQIKDRDNLIATVLSNGTHEIEDPQFVFEALLQTPEAQMGPNKLIERLLEHRYKTSQGSNKKGDRIFWLVPAITVHSDGLGAIYCVRHIGTAEEFADKGYAETVAKSWHVEITLIESPESNGTLC